MRRLVGLLAAGLLGVLAACSSSGSDDLASRDYVVKQAQDYKCPAVAVVSAALGTDVKVVKRSSTGSRTVLCAYGNADAKGTAFVGLTFGAESATYQQTLHALAGSSTTPVAGLGDKADTFLAAGTRQLLVLDNDRVLSITTDPGDTAHETAVAKVFVR